MVDCQGVRPAAIQRLTVEPLEKRQMLSASPWSNPFLKGDVNADGQLDRSDYYQALVPYVDAHLESPVRVTAGPHREPPPEPYLDVNGDRLIDYHDLSALAIILNRRGSPPGAAGPLGAARDGEGEAFGGPSGPRLADLVPSSAMGPHLPDLSPPGATGPVNQELGEGESGGGGGSSGPSGPPQCDGATGPVVYFSNSGPFVREEDGGSFNVVTLRRTCADWGPLTVGLNVTNYGPDTSSADYAIYEGLVPSDLSVTFNTNQHLVVINVDAVSDTIIEENQVFAIEIASSQDYQIGAIDRVDYTILDDEWRWITSDTTDSNYQWWPNWPYGYTVDGYFYDVFLYAHGRGTILNHGVTHLQAWSSASYLGTSHEASTTEGQLFFSCNSQSGDISKTGALPDLTDNTDYVSSALSYAYQIIEIGELMHYVEIALSFRAGVGGTYGDGTHSHDADSGTGTPGTFTAYSGQGYWAKEHPEPGSHHATLQCKKGPEEET